MIGAAIAGGAKIGALFVTLSCTPAIIQGVAADRCDEKIPQSWVDPTPDELRHCADLAASELAAGRRAWCEIIPVDQHGALPTALRF